MGYIGEKGRTFGTRLDEHTNTLRPQQLVVSLGRQENARQTLKTNRQ